MPIPTWNKPPRKPTIDELRVFAATTGQDVSVLVNWTHETNDYTFTTVGSDKLYADAAVRLRDILTANGNIKLNGQEIDLRHEHPNVRLTKEHLFFLLWLLGRTYAALDKMSTESRTLLLKHHDELVDILGDAYEKYETKGLQTDRLDPLNTGLRDGTAPAAQKDSDQTRVSGA